LILKTSTSCFAGPTASSERRPREALLLPSIAFAQSENLLLLAQVAETWSCRPSDLLGSVKRRMQDQEFDPTMALQVDIAAAVALWQWKAEMARRAVQSRE